MLHVYPVKFASGDHFTGAPCSVRLTETTGRITGVGFAGILSNIQYLYRINIGKIDKIFHGLFVYRVINPQE
jgi:hypothetical protein